MNKLKIEKLLEKSNDSTLHYSIRENILNQIQNELISDTEYVEWLDEFTKKRKPVYQKWSCEPYEEAMNGNDKTNRKMLYLFFDSIDKYAKSNFIPQLETNHMQANFPHPIYCDTLIYYYNVKFNDFCFSIRKEYGSRVDYSCIRIKENQEEKYIDFNDVLTNKKQENVDEISNDLATLSNMILHFCDKDIPVKFIKNILDETLVELSNKEKSKKLTKKITN